MVDLDKIDVHREVRKPSYGLTQVCIAEDDFDAMVRELRTLRDRVAKLECDARLGAVVREVAATGGVGSDAPDQLDGYAQSLEDDRSMFGAAIVRAIADALRAEEAAR